MLEAYLKLEAVKVQRRKRCYDRNHPLLPQPLNDIKLLCRRIISMHRHQQKGVLGVPSLESFPSSPKHYPRHM